MNLLRRDTPKNLPIMFPHHLIDFVEIEIVDMASLPLEQSLRTVADARSRAAERMPLNTARRIEEK